MKQILVVLAACLSIAITTSAQTDPFHGTWKLNVAKSKMQPDTASKSETIVLTVVGDEETFVTDAMTASGEHESIKYTARYDGKVYSGTTTITGNTSAVQRMNVVLRKIDAKTRERLGMSDGKITSRARRVLSEDGKTLTSTVFRTDATGKEIQREIRVFEKQ